MVAITTGRSKNVISCLLIVRQAGTVMTEILPVKNKLFMAITSTSSRLVS